MPESLYEDLDETNLEVNCEEIRKLCPIAKSGDYDKVNEGEKYIQSKKFFASGNEHEISVSKLENGKVPPKSVWHKQGYKIHVSAHPNEAVNVANTILPLLNQNSGGILGGVHHKVAELDSYTHDMDPLQRGKFITVYAKDEEQLKLIAGELEKVLIQSGLSGHTHGGKIGPGDQEIGTSGMISMRWGQFGGEPENSVLVGDKFVLDDRSVPCPPSMQQEFDRVVQDTNLSMQQARESLVVQQTQTHGQTPPSISNSNSNSTTSMEPPDDEPKVGSKKVSDVLREQGEWKKQSKRFGTKIDTDELKKGLQRFQKRDDDNDGPSMGGHRQKV